MKYWNKARVRRVRERRERAERRMIELHRGREDRRRTYTRGDRRKNAELMLEVLGTERHRRMLAHLQKSGAMSVSKFAKPFGIGLPAAMRYVHMFERVGLIRTHKRGRIRFCVYAPEALKDLAAYLRSPSALQRR